jgi:outer membrane protein TolC
MLTTEATLLQARSALAATVAAGAQARITLLLTVGGGFEPDSNDIQIAKDVSHD